MKIDVDAVAIGVGPAGEPVGHSRSERVDQPGRVVIAGNVLERDRPAMEVEAVCDPLLVLGHRQGAEVRREDEPDRARDAVLHHLADDVLDPRRPVPHPEVTGVPAIEHLRRARPPACA